MRHHETAGHCVQYAVMRLPVGRQSEPLLLTNQRNVWSWY
ncbi:hypothetical protein [Bacterioplanoides sp.]